jgi:hypothetical protein
LAISRATARGALIGRSSGPSGSSARSYAVIAAPGQRGQAHHVEVPGLVLLRVIAVGLGVEPDDPQVVEGPGEDVQAVTRGHVFL